MHKNQKFSLMHCVAVYPSNNEILNLTIIKELKKRYPNIEIGWSTHEDPWNYEPVKIAYSLGARIFEKHIGINSKKYKLNKYSLTPKAFEAWYDVIIKTKQIIGKKEYFNKRKKEIKTLGDLKRGVYLKNDIKKNKNLTKDQIYFAFPCLKTQLSVSKYSRHIKVKRNLFTHQPVMMRDVIENKIDQSTILKHHLHKVRAILNYSKINLGNSLDLEISHHYGPEKISDYGCVLINCINRKYCKKILVLTYKQRHPLHYHKRKEETFHIIFGTLYSKLNGKLNILKPGDKLLVKPKIKHEFWAGEEGCVFEEVSSTSYNDDSFYLDKIIKKKTREERKTTINYKLIYKD